jgi:N-acetylmuramic acid 6-phosphate (MurNAc-6-P) etherase
MKHKLSPTETLSFNKETIDRLDITEALTVMVQSNNEVVEAVNLALFDIEKVILSIYDRLLKSDDGFSE